MATKRQQTNKQTILLTAVLIASSMLFCGPANAGDTPERSAVEYDLLFLSPGPDGEQIHVDTRADGKNRKTVYQHKSANNAIQWAIKRGRRTVILKGTYRLTAGIKIKRDERTLVVGPEAKLIVGPERDGWPNSVIQVKRANNVRVFTFGLLDGGNTGGGVQFYGIRKDGRSGIKGGLLFATSQLRNVTGGHGIIQTENLNVPLVVASNYGGNLFTSGSNHDQVIGTVAGLATGEQGGEGEAIDFNRYEKRALVDRVIGPAPTVNDEIVDINHCHNLTINRIQAFFGTERKGRLVVGYDLYGVSARFTKRPHLERNKGITIKNIERNRKELDGFSKKVSLHDFPEQLPKLQVNVEIIANFKDGSKRTLLDRAYGFDL